MIRVITGSAKNKKLLVPPNITRPMTDRIKTSIFDLIRELLKQTEGLDAWNMIRFIFINNLKSSFFAIFCGVLFGIVPVAISVVNGYVLGFVANKTIANFF